VVSTRAGVLGPDHPHTLYSASRLAWILILRRKFSEAERISRETRVVQFRVLGQEHPDAADTTCTLASVAAYTGREEEALRLLREAVDHGLKPSEALGIATDVRFEPLRRNSRFRALVSYAHQHAATTTNPQ
jgi:Tetratricopeptide repeat